MKILTVDDHPLILEALRQVLPELHDKVQLITATDRDETLRLARAHPDCALILLDLAVPGAQGMDLLVELREDHAALPVVVLSATADPATVLEAIDSGAMGYIPKSYTPKAMLDALRQVLQGQVHLPPGISPDAPPKPGADLGLSPRQFQVLRLLVQGMPNKLICRKLNLAEGTVKVHVSAVLRALNVRTRTQAVIATARLGLRLDGSAPGTAH
jgi:DNA-binding NarL/FixJ family response regulator